MFPQFICRKSEHVSNFAHEICFVKDVSIIAFTASVVNIDRIMETGLFDDCLFKPVTIKNLKLKIAKFVDHSIIKNQQDEDSKEDHVLESLPEELLKNFDEFHEKMAQDIYPAYEIFRNQLVIYRIEKFTKDLEVISGGYNFSFLKEYGESIDRSLEIFDIENIMEIIGEFPVIINRIYTLAGRNNPLL